MPHPHALLRAILVGCIALALAGCPALGPRTAPPPTADRAEALARQGDHAGAARIYEALAAEATGTDRNDLLLQAARAWLLGRRPDDAARVLAGIGPPALTAEQTLERQLLGVELALVRGQAREAWQQITAIREPAAAPAALRYLQLRMRAAFAAGRPAEGVAAHIARERFLPAPEQRGDARRELLAELRAAAERGARIEPRAAADPTVRGWLELAALAAAAARSPVAATPDIEAWRARYPGHPADEVVRSELLGIDTRGAEPVRHVALLLPVSGRQAVAAGVVRDGFLAAFFEAPPAQRPRLRFYDTAEMSVGEAMTRAWQEGAELIVGPLLREEVVAAAQFTGQRPAVLALNFLPADQLAPAGFYQFALSPEDEARQVAQRLLAEGRRRGVALVPEGDWGARVLAAFDQELLAGGGQLLGEAAFDPALTDYSAEITRVLRITDSRARHRRLESALGTQLRFEPRRRADIEFIFAASPAATARLLRPQLRFHFAGDIPTYATSDAYEPDSPANPELDGIVFPDMPWMLGGELAERVHAALREAWPSAGARRGRLFAFGFDAYRIAAALRAGAAAAPRLDLQGLTGRLTLDAERRVRRELDWAQMRGGQPRPLPRAVE